MSGTSEVLIIGGGVIGLTIARELRRNGMRRITVVERGRVGREASYAAAGMLAPNAENDSHDDFYDLCSESCALYPGFASDLLAETGVDIELERSGTLYLSFSDEDSRVMDGRHLWQRDAGIDVEKLSAAETLNVEPFISPDVRESLFYPNDWQVENRKLLKALKRYAKLKDINVLENTEVRSLVVEDGRAVGVQTESSALFANVTVLATGAWTSLIKIGEVPMAVQVKPIRGQMIGFQPPERMFRRVLYTRRGYIVPRMDGRILSGATVEDAGFDRSTTAEGAKQLMTAAAEIAPALCGLDIREQWSGLRPFAAGGLPVLGEFPQVDDLFVATAHYRNGILLAPVTANLIANLIVNNDRSVYLDVFGFGRLRPRPLDAIC